MLRSGLALLLAAAVVACPLRCALAAAPAAGGDAAGCGCCVPSGWPSPAGERPAPAAPHRPSSKGCICQGAVLAAADRPLAEPEAGGSLFVWAEIAEAGLGAGVASGADHRAARPQPAHPATGRAARVLFRSLQI